ncbi:acetyl-CoA C-acyltransferase [Albibacterium indicum]|uniref:acetyl-CoA C-acyltransferase n=1 Tax=Albibacterium indicum TaxID=2292082 RepID=UPI000E4E1303|nr:acetyl-CoA C-acyltransferase [Pedobacter indicus]
MNKQVFIVAALRTPIGSFGGKLASLTATELAGKVIATAIQRTGIDASIVDELFLGNVLSANLGQAPATQAAKLGGLGDLPATTINKVCASGMKAIMLGAQSIELGINQVVIAGGTESMSNVPYYLDKARTGYRLGHGQMTDGLVKDGLWDVYNDYHMGSAAELCASECKFTREEQDAYAIESYKRSQKASQEGKFKNEIVPIEITGRKGDVTLVDEDEEIHVVNFDKIPQLRPVFKKEGTVTAANASTLNDGAAILILMSKEKVEELRIKPIGQILGYADAQQAPEWFTTAPSKAIPRAIAAANIKESDIDFYEINEAFSVVSLANNKELGLDAQKVNVNGGAVSMGHPLGASGARIVTTLLHVLEQQGGQIGVAGICNGGGGASAMVIKKL